MASLLALMLASVAVPPSGISDEIAAVLAAETVASVLGLHSGALMSDRDIRKAYRRRARAVHPDRHCVDATSVECYAAHDAMVKLLQEHGATE